MNVAYNPSIARPLPVPVFLPLPPMRVLRVPRLVRGPSSLYPAMADPIARSGGGRRHGLGAPLSFPSGSGSGPSTGQNLAAGGAAGAILGVTTAISTGSKVAGGVAGALAMVAPFTGPAAPFIAAAAGLVAPIAALFRGCGQTCVQATEYANQMADALSQVHALYFGPNGDRVPRFRSEQLAALGLIDDSFNQLRIACSDPSLGAAGQRCISERIQPGGSLPGHPGVNWITMYRDPIVNDPWVQNDPSPPAGDSIVGGGSMSAGLLSSLGINPNTQVFGFKLENLVFPALAAGVVLAISAGDN